MAIAIARPLAMPDLTAFTTGPEDRVALINADGTIVGVNEKWVLHGQRLRTPMDQVGPGVNYLEVCRRAAPSSHNAREALRGIVAVLKGKLRFFTMDYSNHSQAGVQYFRMGVTPINYQDARVVVVHTDITELRLSKEKDLQRLQGFARRLIDAQEQERERIAREIHDDLGNRIAVIACSVEQIRNHCPRRRAGQLKQLDAIIANITSLSTALRDLSHLLHPPLLRHLGISVALRALFREFQTTHGLQVDMVIPNDMTHFSDEVELCIFRLSQECLNNIAKHAQASSVNVVLESTAKELRLKIQDNGKGFVVSDESARGLGLISMTERVLSVRGSLSIKSSPSQGTEVSMRIPLPAKKGTSPA